MPRIIGIEAGSINMNDGIEDQNGIWIPKRGGTVIILVLADTESQNYNDILDTPGIPQNFDLYDIGWVKNRNAVEDLPTVHPDTGVRTWLWKVTVTFSSEVNTQQGNNDEEDGDFQPDERTPIVSWDSEEEKENVEKDEDGKPVVTACNEPLFMERNRIIQVLTIKRFEEAPFDPEIQFDYSGYTNSEIFWGAPVGCALCSKIASTETVIEGEKWCEVSYIIKFKMLFGEDDFLEDQWLSHILHQGYKFFRDPGDDLIGGKGPTIFVGSPGHPTTINLDVNGFKLPNNTPPVYLPFRKFPKIDLNELSLGPDF